MTTESTIPCKNYILAALPTREYDAIAPYLMPVHLDSGAVLYEPEAEIQTIYFPTTVLISIVGITQEGMSTEVGMVGAEGMLGLPIFFGATSQPFQVITQLPGEAVTISADDFQKVLRRNPTLQQLLLRYSHTRLIQTTQSAVCNRFHQLEERLCRWLLLAQDRAKTTRLPFTQEFLAEMIGARRAGVGLTASSLQTAGLIRYHRGEITILDRQGLETSACECYKIIRSELDKFLSALPEKSDS